MPYCTFDSNPADDHVHVAIVGQLDAHYGNELTGVLTSHLDNGRIALDVDASEVSFIDSGGLRALVDGARRVRDRDGSFTLVAASDAVRQVLELTDLLGEFGLSSDP